MTVVANDAVNAVSDRLQSGKVSCDETMKTILVFVIFSVPDYYMNQCWFIIHHISEDNIWRIFSKHSAISVHEILFNLCRYSSTTRKHVRSSAVAAMSTRSSICGSLGHWSNSSRFSDAIWRHRSVFVAGWHLNQCSFTINRILWHSSESISREVRLS